MVERAVQGRTRWKRFALAAVPTTLAAGAIVAMMAEGAIAASFAVSGSNFKVSMDELNGKGFQQFGTVDVTKDGKAHPVTVSAIRSATLKNMCQSVLVRTPLGPITVRIAAGGKGRPVKAVNLTVDADQLSGDATFHNIQIGRDASTLDRVPGVVGQAGMFGQQAESVQIKKLKQNAWATTAGTFALNDLDLKVAFGVNECF